MPPIAGTLLGPYEIVSLIGKGGMGEVWKARDSRLGREVAIKFSGEQFTDRFKREAQVIASLNHPNVCTLYDVGPDYLVMELIEGETLGDRIKQGAIPLDEALTIAKQVGDALEAAHEKGITHRDLKPGNIKIRPDGMVKVLDFGLAKIGGISGSQSDDSPTMTIGATQVGMILGTAAYMAPEQARGRVVDKRADIWAFGVVLHEMLTGKRPFHGDDVTDTLASVLKQEPDWQQVPVKVRRLLKACLQKDPKARLHDIGDAWQLLDDDAPPAALAPIAQSRLPWALAGILGLVVIALGLAYWRATAPSEQPAKSLVRLDLDLGADVLLGGAQGASVIISPDGSRLAYISQNRLFSRRLDQPKATELPGTEGAGAPFFSPDGQWVAFFASGQLKKVSVQGGAATVLCAATIGRGGTWSEDGTIIAGISAAGGLYRIQDTGGTPVPLAELDRAHGELTHRWPQALPGGKAVLFTSHIAITGFDNGNVEVITLADHKRKVLMRGATFGRYSSSGHLLYFNQGTLFAIPFDLDTLETHGTPTPVMEDASYSAAFGYAQFDLSKTGTAVYRQGSGNKSTTLQWLDERGSMRTLIPKPGVYNFPSLSPDSTRLAFQVTEGVKADLWIYNFERDQMTPRTFGNSNLILNNAWTPDGRFLVFASQGGISWIRSDTGDQPQILISGTDRMNPLSITGDGKRLAFMQADPDTAFDIWTAPLENDGTTLHAGKAEPFVKTAADERHSVFSPDGRWVAFSSNKSGIFQIYVRSFPDGREFTISTNGGVYPLWAWKANELFFRTEDYQVMAVSYKIQGDNFIPEKPRVWTDKRLADVGLLRTFDVTPDGKRIIALMPVNTPEAQAAQTHVVYLENFTDEVRRRVK